MKFIFSKDIREQSPFKVILVMYLLLSLLFYVSMFFLEDFNLGLSAQDLKTKILGNDVLFVQAMSWEDLILNIHIKLFLYIFSSLVALSVFIKTDSSPLSKVNFSILLFSLIILETLSCLAIKWVGNFAYLKSMSFIFLQVLSIYICLKSLLFLCTQSKKSVGP